MRLPNRHIYADLEALEEFLIRLPLPRKRNVGTDVFAGNVFITIINIYICSAKVVLWHYIRGG